MEGALTVSVLSPLVAFSTADTALLVAVLSGVVSLLGAFIGAFISRRTAIDVVNRDLTAILASDRLDHRRGMLWADEQRAIGELMVVDPPDAPSYVQGHAAFHRDYDEVFAPWMEGLAKEVVSLDAGKSIRLEPLQWGLFGLARRLDEEDAYPEVGWTRTAQKESTRRGPVLRSAVLSVHVKELLGHLEAMSGDRDSIAGRS